MTEEQRKLLAEKLGRELKPEDVHRIDCGLTLYTLAAIVAHSGRKTIAEEQGLPVEKEDAKKDEADAVLDAAGLNGAVAESYNANIDYLKELTEDRMKREVSPEEVVAAWKKLYGFLVSEGLRPAITYRVGKVDVPLPFERIHSNVMDALRIVRDYRRSKKGEEK